MTCERSARNKQQQGYDPAPPICLQCVYFKREPMDTSPQHVRRKTRSGYKWVQVAARSTRSNPTVDRCTFGNFVMQHAKGVCDEWRDRDGNRLDQQ